MPHANAPFSIMVAAFFYLIGFIVTIFAAADSRKSLKITSCISFAIAAILFVSSLVIAANGPPTEPDDYTVTTMLIAKNTNPYVKSDDENYYFETVTGSFEKVPIAQTTVKFIENSMAAVQTNKFHYEKTFWSDYEDYETYTIIIPI